VSPLFGQKHPAGRTAVYRLFDAAGDLLYIGSSNNPRIRCYEHASTKRWWPEVALRTEAWLDTRDDALAHEKHAILVESPRYNVQHTPLHRKVSAFQEELTPDEAALWTTTKPKGARNLGRKPWHMKWAGAAEYRAAKAPGTLLAQQIAEGRTGGKGKPVEPDKTEA
jgi:hypothetical protein